ncbi:MAG: DMT family transporter [Pseudomonadota bacterium]
MSMISLGKAMGPDTNTQNVTGGVILIIATALTISVQDVVFKLFSTNLTLWQIFALRGLMTVPMLVAIGYIRGTGFDVIRSAYRFWPLLRGMCLTMTFLAFYAAIPFLSLSTVGAANYIAPIFVALLSAYVIKEAVGLWGWIGVILGFAGVIVLLQPGTDAFSPFALLPILGAAFYAIGHILTRTRCKDTPVEALALSLNTVMLLSGFVISGALIALSPNAGLVEDYPYLLGAWSAVTSTDWIVLAVLAGFAVVLGMMLAGAYQMAPPATVATFEYSYLVFVAAWDILFFDLIPTATTLIGMAMIVGAGILVMRGRPT